MALDFETWDMREAHQFLYQGTTSVVPQGSQKVLGFSPCLTLRNRIHECYTFLRAAEPLIPNP
jgi:hypothetical protein